MDERDTNLENRDAMRIQQLEKLVIDARELLRSCPFHKLPESVSHPKWYRKFEAWEQRVNKALEQ